MTIARKSFIEDVMVTQNKMRLNKYIAQSGIVSRRKADEMISQGEVKVNGRIVTELGTQVDLTKDSVKIGKKLLKPTSKFVYFMLNKPTSVLSTLDDPEGRKTIKQYISNLNERVFPVGRLDWDSEGLLLLTNDGNFSQQVAHPTQKVPKTYLVKLKGLVTDKKLEKLVNGVTIPGGRVKALLAEKLPNQPSKHTWIKIIIEEGKNRQIRYMAEKIDCDVIKLQRVAIGMLKLGRLKKGQVRELGLADIEKIFYKFKKSKVMSPAKGGYKKKRKDSSSFKSKKPKGKTLSRKEYFKKVRRASKDS